MLAINVSITTGQSPAWSSSDRQQLRLQRERPTDARVDWKQSILYTKASCPFFPPESICS